METELIKPSNLGRAAALLRSGKLVAFPTDTYFALGAVMEENAVRAVFEAKGRMADNPVPVLLSGPEQVKQVSGEQLPDAVVALTRKWWPGALTVVLAARADVPGTVTAGTGTVGVRVPDHELARQLIALSDSPLTGTSANRSGSPPCKTAAEVMDQLGGLIAGVVDAPCGVSTAASTVVALHEGKPKILREGAISGDDVRAALAN